MDPNHLYALLAPQMLSNQSGGGLISGGPYAPSLLQPSHNLLAATTAASLQPQSLPYLSQQLLMNQFLANKTATATVPQAPPPTPTTVPQQKQFSFMPTYPYLISNNNSMIPVQLTPSLQKGLTFAEQLQMLQQAQQPQPVAVPPPPTPPIDYSAALVSLLAQQQMQQFQRDMQTAFSTAADTVTADSKIRTTVPRIMSPLTTTVTTTTPRTTVELKAATPPVEMPLPTTVTAPPPPLSSLRSTPPTVVPDPVTVTGVARSSVPPVSSTRSSSSTASSSSSSSPSLSTTTTSRQEGFIPSSLASFQANRTSSMAPTPAATPITVPLATMQSMMTAAIAAQAAVPSTSKSSSVDDDEEMVIVSEDEADSRSTKERRAEHISFHRKMKTQLKNMKDKDLVCRLCGKQVMKNEHAFKSHLAEHATGSVEITCRYCGFETNSRVEMNYHITEKHPNGNMKSTRDRRDHTKLLEVMNECFGRVAKVPPRKEKDEKEPKDPKRPSTKRLGRPPKAVVEPSQTKSLDEVLAELCETDANKDRMCAGCGETVPAQPVAIITHLKTLHTKYKCTDCGDVIETPAKARLHTVRMHGGDEESYLKRLTDYITLETVRERLTSCFISPPSDATQSIGVSRCVSALAVIAEMSGRQTPPPPDPTLSPRKSPDAAPVLKAAPTEAPALAVAKPEELLQEEDEEARLVISMEEDD